MKDSIIRALAAAVLGWGIAGAQSANITHDPLPLVFETNAGQLAEGVDFLARGKGFGIALSAGEATLYTSDSDTALSLRLVGANTNPLPAGDGRLDATVSYFKGSDPAGWRTEVPLFERARYESVYPGIDLVYYPNKGALEYDFILAPGARVDDVRLRFEGASAVRLSPAGALELTLPGGTMVQHAPIVYQELGGERVDYSGRYLQHGDGTLGFVVERYDPALPLVIDPVITYSALFTGSAFDASTGVLARADVGQPIPYIYTVGNTQGLSQTQNLTEGGLGGDSDIFVARINPAIHGPGSLVSLAIIGGSGRDIAVDIGAYVSTTSFFVVAGSTSSADFPLLNPKYSALNQGANATSSDGFVIFLTQPVIALAGSTYFGGSGDDQITAFTVLNNRLYLTGTTASTDFPIAGNAFATTRGPGATDAFLSVLTASGIGPVTFNETYSSYLGATSALPRAIDTLDLNRPVIAGQTGDGLNTKAALQTVYNLGAGTARDGFVAGFDISQSVAPSTLVFNTYFGGSGADDILGIDCANGAMHIAGTTSSADFPGNIGQPLSGTSDAFVAQLNPPGLSLQVTQTYSQLLGGPGDDGLSEIIVVDTNTLFTAGYTNSASGIIPASPDRDPVQSVLNPGQIAGDNPLANDILLYDLRGLSTVPGTALVSSFTSYLGGRGTDVATDMFRDTSGRIYLTGATSSSNFPQSGSFDPGGYRGANEGFITVLQDVIHVDAASAATAPCGSSWGDPCGSLTAASASSGNNQEIWVKAGTYQEVFVNFLPGVQVYGGFAGNETVRDARDWVANPTIIDGNDGGGIFNAVDNCRFDGLRFTRAQDTGGAVLIDSRSNVRVENCIFYENQADYGPGVAAVDGSRLAIVNSIFIHNDANDAGGAIYLEDTDAIISQCTFFDNATATGDGDAIYTESSGLQVHVYNSILWHTTSNAEQIFVGGSDPEVSHCIVKNGYPDGTTIIDADPLFMAAPQRGVSLGDLRLQSTSPARDKGIDTSGDARGSVTKDFNRNHRHIRGTNCIYDLGAYETDPDTPQIVLVGDNPLVLEVNTAYTEQGATAADGCGVDLTSAVVVDSSAVNTAAVGNYLVTYNVSNDIGQAAAEIMRAVEVRDTTPPVITLIGASTVTVQCGASYTDAGATATDNGDGNLTASIVTNSTVNTAALGSYSVTYDVTDSSGNPAPQVVRTVNVVDTTPPVILLSGGTVVLDCGDAYTEPGFTATDNCDGDLTGAVAVDMPTITGPGTYTVRYNVSDAQGNPAAEVTRAVQVADTQEPVIILTGSTNIVLECGEAFDEPGFTATDACDGDLTGAVSVTIEMVGKGAGITAPGSYAVVYIVEDAAGNEAVETRALEVVDTTPPVITLLGAATMNVECGSAFTDPGATANDACDGTLPVTVGGDTVDTTQPGVYVITYDAEDGKGNEAVRVTRQVTVRDTTNPVVTLNGAATVQVECGSVFSDPGATANDNCDGALPATPDRTVDTAAPGVTTITYTATDSDGNTGVRQRTVQVVDTTAPEITLLGSATINIECGGVFTDPGFVVDDECDALATADVIVGGVVDTANPGPYEITYEVTDASGNHSGVVRRTVVVADSQAPNVTLLGANPIVLECGAAFTDPGATATDACDGALPVTPSGAVDTAVPANYNITYTAVDGEGHSTSVQRTVIVQDTQDPVIALMGSTDIILECGEAFDDPGYTAADGCGGDLTHAVEVEIEGRAKGAGILPQGLYVVNYTVEDAAGNEAFASRNLTVVDTEGPVITLNGSATITLNCGAAYVEQDAVALDACTGIVPVVISGDAVDSNVIGTYEIYYDAVDVDGNAATRVTRTVHVVSDSDPVVTLTGNSTQTLECGAVYIEEGASAFDDCSVDLTAQIVTLGTVDTSTPGVYPITYRVTDSDNNIAEQIRTVTVADTQPPVMTLLGANQVTVACGTAYVDAGATSVDACDGDITAGIVVDTGTLNTSDPGVYTVTLRSTDSSGRTATLTRTVVVEDNIAPVIALNGPALVNVNCGATYNDPGAVATDGCDSTLTVSRMGIVNTNVPGSYTLTYNVTDSDGNSAAPVTRTVNVVDLAPPTLTLQGAATVTVDCGRPYNEPGVIALDTCEGNISGDVVVTGNVNTAVPGTYTLTYNVKDSSNNAAGTITRTVVVRDNCGAEGEGEGSAEGEGAADGEGSADGEGEGEGGHPLCYVPCEGVIAPDEDGDGLNQCEEEAFGTSDSNTDTDGDGMPDGWEARYCPVLDPLDPADAVDNPDGDAFDNLHEFINRSHPLLAESPVLNIYVALIGGSDAPGRGTRGAPYATIAYAMSQVSSTVDSPVYLMLYDGLYEENVVMQPGMAILPVPGAEAAIAGTIVGAEGALLSDLTIAPRVGGVTLLTINNVAMRVVRCTFLGTSRRDSTGIVITGSRAREVVIEECLFQRLAVGIDVDAGLPAMRRSEFDLIVGAGIIIRDNGQSALSQYEGDDPRTGYNTFLPTVQGPAVINEFPEPVNMERNDWGVEDPSPETISEVIVGEVNFKNYLVPGAALFSGALFTTVWDARDQEPIRNARVSVQPAGLSTVTENVEGVYAFPALSSGSYDVVVTAPGYASQTKSVSLSDGQLLSVVVAMRSTGEEEGEGEGVEEGEGEGETPSTGGCPCNNQNKLGPPQPGDITLAVGVLATLMASAWSMRRQTLGQQMR